MTKKYTYERVAKVVAEKGENNSIVVLSDTLKEVHYLLLDERLTPLQIAKYKGIKHQSVYKSIKKLKDLGLIKQVAYNSYNMGGQYPNTTKSNNKEYRLHGINLKIKILSKGKNYLDLLQKKNVEIIDNNNIRLFEDTIIIYMNKDFWGVNVNESVRLCLDYTTRFITKLENRYNIDLKKHSTSNIKLFRCEIAKVNDPIAKEINLSGEKLKVYDNRGNLRLIVDKSFKFDELEAVHKNYSIEDMSKVQSFYNDILNEETPLISDVFKLVKDLIQYTREQAEHQIRMQNENMLIMRSLMQEIKQLKEK